MTPLSSSRCPSCDSPLPPDGLCVACLLAAGAGLALTPEPEDAPRSFGEYELIAEIGRGGMGRVFRARHRRLQREAAVKVVAGGDLASREFVERFHTEMLAAAALQHPHIVALHEAGECEGSLFLAMALVSGGSLHEVMHSGRRFTPREAAALVAPLAHAVHHGHQRGVLHRDIKPGNILLDTAGVPYLTDFGLARLMEHDSTLTRTNALLGTPAYMAPEQARGETATTAVDVYGLGAVLYELLTGRPPFAGGTTMETVRLLLEKAPEPPSRFAAVERDLEKVTLKCLAKNPADRYASADALAHDLEAWREGRPVTARLPGAPELVWKWMRRRPLLASALGIAALAVLTAGVVTAVFSRKLEHAHGLSQELAEQRRSEVARLYAEECAAHLERHDAVRAFAAAVESLAMEEAADSPSRAQAVRAARRRAAAVRQTCPVLRQVWGHPSAVRDGVFSPDGSLAVCLSGNELHGYDVATGRRRLGPVDCGPTNAARWTESLAFDRTGSRLTFLGGAEGGAPLLRVLDVAAVQWSGEPVTLAPTAWVPRFHPDGARVPAALPDSVCWIRTADAAPAGVIRAGAATAIALSADGHTVAVGDAEGRVFLHDADTGALRHGPLTMPVESGAAPAPVHQIVFSADGMALAALTSGSMAAAMWRLPSAEPAPALLYNGGVSSLAFSPDSSRLLTAGFGTTRLRDVSGREAPGGLIEHPGYLTMAAWSPDSTTVATCGTEGHVFFWSARLNEEIMARLPHASQVNSLAWSPDGTSVLTTGNDGRMKLWELPHGDFSVIHWQSPRPVDAVRWLEGSNTIRCFTGTQAADFAADTGRALAAVPQQQGLPENAVTAPGARLYAAGVPGSKDGAFELRETATHRTLQVRRHPGVSAAVVLRFTFSRDGRQFLSYCERGPGKSCAAALWTLTPEGPDYGVTLPHFDGVLCADFSPDGGLIATAGMDTTVRLWRTGDGAFVGALPRHDYWVWDVRFSPDGAALASASADHTARVWDVRTLTALSPPLPHQRIVRALDWNPQSTQLITADAAGLLRLWDLLPASESVEMLRVEAAKLLPRK